MDRRTFLRTLITGVAGSAIALPTFDVVRAMPMFVGECSKNPARDYVTVKITQRKLMARIRITEEAFDAAVHAAMHP